MPHMGSEWIYIVSVLHPSLIHAFNRLAFSKNFNGIVFCFLMDLWRPIRFLVLAILVGYFVLEVIDSWSKLQQREIGLSFERIREELVEGSHNCYCCIILTLCEVVS